MTKQLIFGFIVSLCLLVATPQLVEAKCPVWRPDCWISGAVRAFSKYSQQMVTGIGKAAASVVKGACNQSGQRQFHASMIHSGSKCLQSLSQKKVSRFELRYELSTKHDGAAQKCVQTLCQGLPNDVTKHDIRLCKMDPTKMTLTKMANLISREGNLIREAISTMACKLN